DARPDGQPAQPRARADAADARAASGLASGTEPRHQLAEPRARIAQDGHAIARQQHLDLERGERGDAGAQQRPVVHHLLAPHGQVSLGVADEIAVEVVAVGLGEPGPREDPVDDLAHAAPPTRSYAGAPPRVNPTPRLYTRAFWIACAVHFTGGMSMGMFLLFPL